MLVDLNKNELEYLLECLNFHYSESDNKEECIDLNAELCVKLHSISQVCTCKENEV